MVIQETLRLYPPGVFVSRKSLQDIQLKHILVPKGKHIQIPTSILHQDTDLWGPDARQFNPGRFENGVLGSCKLSSGFHPLRNRDSHCVGQRFAMIELKVIISLIISLILSKLCFSLSLTNRHSPTFNTVVEPEQGINLHVERAWLLGHVLNTIVSFVEADQLGYALFKNFNCKSERGNRCEILLIKGQRKRGNADILAVPRSAHL